MKYSEVVSISNTYLLPQVTELYELEGYEITLVDTHEGGRNVIYNCEKGGLLLKYSESLISKKELRKSCWPRLNMFNIYLSMEAVSQMLSVPRTENCWKR